MPGELIEPVAGVLLAGGQSARMGTDKAFLRIGDRTLIETCVAALRRCFVRNLIIANRPDAFVHLGLPVWQDDLPGLGPLGGILTGLRHAEAPSIFVVACDMPFLDPGLIRLMAGAMGGFDAVAAKVKGRFEPLHALYHRRILPAVEARIASKDYSVFRLLESLRVRSFTEAELESVPGWQRSLLNVNTPEELERARERG
jgi:molybdopterin-guanine dinucleotide biosynthesis protein A